MTSLWPTLTVQNVEVSLSFYRDDLGLPQDFCERDASGVAFMATVEVGDTVIMFESPDPALPPEPRRGERCPIAITILFPPLYDLASLFARLREKGHTICSDLGNRPWGNRDFSVRDPDGYLLILAQPLT